MREFAGMKKLLAVVVLALVVAAAVWVMMRMQLAKRLATVPELLPGTTLLLAEAPDPRRSRERWHGSDLYQIWREPAVQSWLQKPLERLPQNDAGRKTVEEFFDLHPTHGFVALTALEKNEPTVVGGFHFDGAPEEARKFIAQREAEWLPKNAGTKRETIDYEQHQIEKVTVSNLVLVTVYHNQWFFASNDVATLKGLLDRADRRREKSGPSLPDKKAFSETARHLPSDYAGMLYVDPRPFVKKLVPLIALTGQSLPMNQLERLGQVQSVASAIRFDNGKMRETDYVAMPRVGAEKKLTRTLLGAAGANTFLYSLSRVHWSDKALSSSAPTTTGLPALVRQFASALRARGISPEDLRQAFGEELEVAGDWRADAHWPTFLVTLPVNDSARARKVAEALTSVEIAGMPWTRDEKNGALFYHAQPFGGFVPVNPAIAVSDRVMLAGSDLVAVEGALTKMAAPTNELEKRATFHDAAALVPPAGSAFNYVDTRLLFERADAALRPLLVMGATFYPAFGKNVDVTKLPPPEAIAKHLSPIVMSQRYEGDGYVTESVGPVTFREATLGLAGVIGGVLIHLREGNALLQNLSASPSPAPALAAPSGSPEPTETPTPSPF
jgi:hypothetical protein